MATFNISYTFIHAWRGFNYGSVKIDSCKEIHFRTINDDLAHFLSKNKAFP